MIIGASIGKQRLIIWIDISLRQTKIDYLNRYLIYTDIFAFEVLCGFKNVRIRDFRKGEFFDNSGTVKNRSWYVVIGTLNRWIVIVKSIKWENWFSVFRWLNQPKVLNFSPKFLRIWVGSKPVFVECIFGDFSLAIERIFSVSISLQSTGSGIPLTFPVETSAVRIIRF